MAAVGCQRSRPVGRAGTVSPVSALAAECVDELFLGHRGATLDAEYLGPLLQFLDGPLLVGAGVAAPGLTRSGLRAGRAGLDRRAGRLALRRGGLGAVGHDRGGTLGRLRGTLGRTADAGAGRLHAAAGGAGAVDRLACGRSAADRADQVTAAAGEVVELVAGLDGQVAGGLHALVEQVPHAGDAAVTRVAEPVGDLAGDGVGLPRGLHAQPVDRPRELDPGAAEPDGGVGGVDEEPRQGTPAARLVRGCGGCHLDSPWKGMLTIALLCVTFASTLRKEPDRLAQHHRKRKPTKAACGCRKTRPPYATWAYSWMSPPSRSTRTIRRSLPRSRCQSAVSARCVAAVSSSFAARSLRSAVTPSRSVVWRASRSASRPAADQPPARLKPAAIAAPSSQQAFRLSGFGAPSTLTGACARRHPRPCAIASTARTAPVVSLLPWTYRP